VLDWLVDSVRATGRLGVIGVYVPSDPGAATESARDGRIGFDFGKLFQKGLSLGTGQCPVKRYNEHLRDLIIAGRATPANIVSHALPLTEAAGAYDQFDKRVDGCTKVILHPAA
jgi:glutathione-independent formaldehyde dehydrogenase